ncbi:unnamed protein product [Mycena citricolor]|uniref:Uncharacterized protein n=1 Tax=Mycena citricolor TaxID=2018698 RepID=A0AAD2H998_9AGAR|nr:unnamed protein product [Mycena citricolor]
MVSMQQGSISSVERFIAPIFSTGLGHCETTSATSKSFLVVVTCDSDVCRTFDLLLGEDSSQWSLVAKLHMVMIPTGLIMTRLGLGHITAVTLGSWPTFAFIPAVMHQSKSLDLTHSSLTGEGAKLPWPPSPFVFGFILLPLCQRFYRHYFNKFSNWVLNANPAAGPARRRQPGLRGLLQGILDDMERAAEARAAQQPNEDNDRADIQVEVEGEPAVLSVDIRKACRLVGGALLSPLIASAMGKLLLRISSYFPLLRRFLAIRPASTGFLPAPFLRRYSPTEIWRRVTDPTIKDGKLDLTQTLKFVSRAVWGDMRKLDECDPVWWRNSIGFGIFIMTKDLLQLLHVWLSKREVASRRVKSWDFSAVDPRELDLIRPSVRADLTMPGAL